MMNRGQAAIEFLVTYGWAIMGVLITIGALSYFGVFNTQKYVNDVCYFGDQMKCEDFVLYNDSWTSFKLRNNFGVAINITRIEIYSDYGTSTCRYLTNVFQAGTNNPNNIPAGSQFEINCNLTQARNLNVNDKVKFKAIIEFAKSGSVNRHNQTGDLLVGVQKQVNRCGDGIFNCHDNACEALSPDTCGSICTTSPCVCTDAVPCP